MEEQLRKELMMATANVLGEKAASKLEMAFTIVLHKYKVETKIQILSYMTILMLEFLEII